MAQGRARRPGNIIIARNLGNHKGRPARQLIRDAAAHLLFLPPYSPGPISYRYMADLMLKERKRLGLGAYGLSRAALSRGGGNGVGRMR